jgi:hypothetical protein
MLLTDGNPNTTEDLRVYESAILDVANAEQIDLEAKLGLATEELSQEVLDMLLDHTRALDPQLGALQWNMRRTIGVSDVVVTRQLKRWHAAHTLAVVYRDAFNNQLNDRYQAKFSEYREVAKDAKTHTVRYGIGLSLTPLPKAPAPVVSFAAAQQAAATYFIQVAWVSAQGQEGAVSDSTSFEAAAGSVPVVRVVNPPPGATGFNVYMGLTSVAATLQNATAVAVGQSFTLPSTGLVQGRTPGTGQSPDVYVTGGPMLRRG